MHNASSVIQLSAAQEKLSALEQDHAALSAEFAEVSRVQGEYESLVHGQQEQLGSYERRMEALQRECYEKVDSATELAEKQNALTMTLEAKVTQKKQCLLIYNSLLYLQLFFVVRLLANCGA